MANVVENFGLSIVGTSTSYNFIIQNTGSEPSLFNIKIRILVFLNNEAFNYFINNNLKEINIKKLKILLRYNQA